MENSSVFGPVSIQASGLEVLIALLEEEVVFDQLLSLGVCEALEWVVGSPEVSLEEAEAFLCVLFDHLSLEGADESA